jgi:5-methyltetrahydropteroyltriglutamate--homocysteine methyltransferase
MARGRQASNGHKPVSAMEMTKWFDTNYHYIVPEFRKGQRFRLSSDKPFDEFREALALGIRTRPVLLGPVTYLSLGKPKEGLASPWGLLDGLLEVYVEALGRLKKAGAQAVQIDEPILVTDLDSQQKSAFKKAYARFSDKVPGLGLHGAAYFGSLGANLPLVRALPLRGLHVDLCRAPEQLAAVLKRWPRERELSLGVVDGRNIWKNDLAASLRTLARAAKGRQGTLSVAGSCSFLHVPLDLDLEKTLDPEVSRWMAFAKQKLEEVSSLKNALSGKRTDKAYFRRNALDLASRKKSRLTHDPAVRKRLAAIQPADSRRAHPFKARQAIQQGKLGLPSFPTTTIGSFPQTADVRKARAEFKRGALTQAQYEAFLREKTAECVRRQEQLGLDVLVHGEFERNDMVEYFGEKLEGFLFTSNGWVQSYGSRCVKPPVIFGDVSRLRPMTVEWTRYAQSLTSRPVKGMLTGPVTILQWSFVRDDQPRSTTARQIALAIRDEVRDLEGAGIGVIQIDEPAIREGLPLRRKDWKAYLQWAVGAFRLASSGVRDETQIHTHMCYSEFNDILPSVAAMDADVISIEASRSQMELLDAFARFRYPNEIGPGVYDIHSPRVPSSAEIAALLKKASKVVPGRNLWVNPDCGLKTRGWEECLKSLQAMIAAAHTLRK